MEREDTGEIHADGKFRTTQWSLILIAADTSSPEAREALAKLCEKYWPPLYAFVRRLGHQPEDAQDLVQGFFANLIEKNYLQDVNRERGRFRSFLLAALKHYMANEWQRRKAQKRGGGQTLLSLDLQSAEDFYKIEPVDSLTPERIYERRWVMSLLEQTVGILRQDFVRQGKEDLFDVLKPFLTVDEERLSYEELSRRCNMSEGAVKTTVHRLRRQFGELLRKTIANTLSNPGDLDDEIRYLFTIYS